MQLTATQLLLSHQTTGRIALRTIAQLYEFQRVLTLRIASREQSDHNPLSAIASLREQSTADFTFGELWKFRLARPRAGRLCEARAT
jgi:hypothetical protein